jgi:hypothetical protein
MQSQSIELRDLDGVSDVFGEGAGHPGACSVVVRKVSWSEKVHFLSWHCSEIFPLLFGQVAAPRRRQRHLRNLHDDAPSLGSSSLAILLRLFSPNQDSQGHVCCGQIPPTLVCVVHLLKSNKRLIDCFSGWSAHVRLIGSHFASMVLTSNLFVFLVSSYTYEIFDMLYRVWSFFLAEPWRNFHFVGVRSGNGDWALVFWLLALRSAPSVSVSTMKHWKLTLRGS